jgi:hypothetical protein
VEKASSPKKAQIAPVAIIQPQFAESAEISVDVGSRTRNHLSK